MNNWGDVTTEASGQCKVLSETLPITRLRLYLNLVTDLLPSSSFPPILINPFSTSPQANNLGPIPVMSSLTLSQKSYALSKIYFNYEWPPLLPHVITAVISRATKERLEALDLLVLLLAAECVGDVAAVCLYKTEKNQIVLS